MKIKDLVPEHRKEIEGRLQTYKERTKEMASALDGYTLQVKGPELVRSGVYPGTITVRIEELAIQIKCTSDYEIQVVRSRGRSARWEEARDFERACGRIAQVIAEHEAGSNV